MNNAENNTLENSNFQQGKNLKLSSNYHDLERRCNRISRETRKRAIKAEMVGTLLSDIVKQIGLVEKKKNYKSYCICFISLILSVIAIFLSFRIGSISVEGYNLMGWLIGIITILVTILIGFQIYKSIELKDIINETINSTREKIIKEVYDEFKNHENEFHNKNENTDIFYTNA